CRKLGSQTNFNQPCMIIIVLLIAISLTIALIFLGAFIWSLRSGQYNDLYGPSVRMLFEDKKKKE
ncbi:MAG TPA: cbb3-type cytochrome oxidase assembly protein CcoS, partial [Cyclobacteriaceae bacterium]|nr:cbb3-type cytochrome oxidase assembly protein CcoS [Cyclobacteriaceae bacterium]